MTFFKNNTVSFISLNPFKTDFGKRSAKQIGLISKAIDTLDVINEDIAIRNRKDYDIINKMNLACSARLRVKNDNKDLSLSLKQAIK